MDRRTIGLGFGGLGLVLAAVALFFPGLAVVLSAAALGLAIVAAFLRQSLLPLATTTIVGLKYTLIAPTLLTLLAEYSAGIKDIAGRSASADLFRFFFFLLMLLPLLIIGIRHAHARSLDWWLAGLSALGFALFCFPLIHRMTEIILPLSKPHIARGELLNSFVLVLVLVAVVAMMLWDFWRSCRGKNQS